MAELFKRHRKACPNGKTKRNSCACVYWAAYTPPGATQKERVSLRTASRDVAEAKARSLEMGGGADLYEVPSESLTLEAAIDLVVTVHCARKAKGTKQSYRNKGKRLLEVFDPEADVADIRREHINEYIQKRTRAGMVPHTIHKELVVLRIALQLANERGACGDPRNVIPKFSAKYKPVKRWLTRHEFDRLMTAEPHHDRQITDRRPWFALMALAGADVADIERLRREDVDFEGGFVHLRGTKTETRDRYVPIADELRPWLEAECARHDAQRKSKKSLLFPRWHNPGRDMAIWCERAAIEPASPKDLRRTFGSWLKQAGADSKAVADLLGHTSTRMVEMVYGHLDEKTYRRTIEMLPRKTGRHLKAVK